jgi:RNA-binding protein Musashi
MQKPKTRGGSYPKVFLGGLPSNVTETDLRMFFGRYGKVMEVVIMYDQEKKKSRGFGFLSFEDEASVERVTTEHYITLNGKQVEIKKAEPRDGSTSHKMNPDGMNQSAGSHWGPGPSMMQGMQGPNGQMNAPPMSMMSSPMNMMSGYQGWGGNPTAQQQNYGYGNPNPGYQPNQGWGPQPTQPQWGAAAGYNAGQAQTQQYGSYGKKIEYMFKIKFSINFFNLFRHVQFIIWTRCRRIWWRCSKLEFIMVEFRISWIK